MTVFFPLRLFLPWLALLNAAVSVQIEEANHHDEDCELTGGSVRQLLQTKHVTKKIHATTKSSQTVQLVDIGKNKCLDLYREFNDNYGRVDLWGCHTADNQQWILDESPGSGAIKIRSRIKLQNKHVCLSALACDRNSGHYSGALRKCNSELDKAWYTRFAGHWKFWKGRYAFKQWRKRLYKSLVVMPCDYLENRNYQVCKKRYRRTYPCGLAPIIQEWEFQTTASGLLLQPKGGKACALRVPLIANDGCETRFWKVKSMPFMIKDGAEKQCMDYGFYNNWKSNVYMGRCHGAHNQQWYFDGEQLKTKQDDKCLAESSGADRNVYMSPCLSGDNEKWYFENGQLKNKQSSVRCLDMHRATKNLHMFNCHKESNQKFKSIEVTK